MRLRVHQQNECGERRVLEGCRWCCARKTSLGGVPLDRIVKFSGRWLAKRRCSEMCRRGGNCCRPLFSFSADDNWTLKPSIVPQKQTQMTGEEMCESRSGAESCWSHNSTSKSTCYFCPFRSCLMVRVEGVAVHSQLSHSRWRRTFSCASFVNRSQSAGAPAAS